MFSRDDTFKNAEMRHFCCKRKSSHPGIAKELKEQHGLLLKRRNSKHRGLEKVLVGLGNTEVEENTLLSSLPTVDSNDTKFGSSSPPLVLKYLSSAIKKTGSWQTTFTHITNSDQPVEAPPEASTPDPQGLPGYGLSEARSRTHPAAQGRSSARTPAPGPAAGDNWPPPLRSGRPRTRTPVTEAEYPARQTPRPPWRPAKAPRVRTRYPGPQAPTGTGRGFRRVRTRYPGPQAPTGTGRGGGGAGGVGLPARAHSCPGPGSAPEARGRGPERGGALAGGRERGPRRVRTWGAGAEVLRERTRALEPCRRPSRREPSL